MMDENIFRIPVDEPNYSRVLKVPVKLKEIRHLPKALESMDTTRVWAVKPGPNNEKLYNQLQSNDALLFYLGAKHRPVDEGLYVAIGRVGMKFQGSEDAAREFFRNIHATRMYTVDEFEVISKSSADIKQILGYKGAPEGPHRIHESNYSSVDRVVAALRS